jgi:hypothetical protein
MRKVIMLVLFLRMFVWYINVEIEIVICLQQFELQ